jgi:quinohemoprotein ethanol dehydrogenase
MPPSPPPQAALPIDDPALVVDAAKAAEGSTIYARSCALCHGGGVVSGGSAPDLRASPVPLSREGFAAVVVKGERSSAGMPSFPAYGERELDALASFIRTRARETLHAAAGGTEKTTEP